MTRITLLAFLLTAGLLAACGGGGESATVTPAPSSDATMTSVATETAIAIEPATEPADRFQPPGDTSGVVIVDEVIAAVTSGSERSFLNLLEYTDVACVPTSGEVVFPTCPGGTAPGTPVASLLTARCDLGWTPREVIEADSDFARRSTGMDRRLYAVVNLEPPPAPVTEGGNPPALYLAIFGTVAGNATDILGIGVSDTGIVFAETGCGDTASSLADRYFTTTFEAHGRATGYLVPPPANAE